jgi:hypothetical protein
MYSYSEETLQYDSALQLTIPNGDTSVNNICPSVYHGYTINRVVIKDIPDAMLNHVLSINIQGRSHPFFKMPLFAMERNFGGYSVDLIIPVSINCLISYNIKLDKESVIDLDIVLRVVVTQEL